MNPITRGLLALFFLLGALPLHAYSSHTWGHLQGRHFIVSYNEVSAPYADRVLAIAEETRAALTKYFGDTLDSRRISIVVTDDSDQPNGGAFEADPVVLIDCRKGPSLLRGESDWLRTVVTHELSHQYSFQVLRGGLPFSLELGTVAGESTVNTDFSFTSNTLEYPVWLIEGLAQMGSRTVGADSHDVIRQLVLRDAWLNRRLLSLSEMGRFEGTSTDYELAYNQGFAFLAYLESRFDKVSLGQLCRRVAQIGLQRAAVNLYKRTLDQLHKDWVDSLETQFSGFQGKSTGSREFPDRGLLTMETDQTPSGRAVVANWDNDYTRFQLFVKDPVGRYRAVAQDVGPQVVEDPVTGLLWFTRDSFDFGTGLSTPEVFQLLPSGRQVQVTTRERVLAFDVWEGRLIRARYHEGTTEVVLREPDGTDKILGSFPASMAVYSLSAVSPESVVLSVGTGERVQAVVLTDGSASPLWGAYEVMDVVSLAQDRFAFVATKDGTPQLYWVDMAEDPTTWYQLTDLPTGARFPRVGTDPDTLTYSQFASGGWQRARLTPAFSKDHPVAITGPAIGEPLAQEDPPTPKVGDGPSATNLVFHADPLWFGLFGYDATSSQGTRSTVWNGQAGWQFSFYDAPGDWQVSLGLALSSLLDSSDPSVYTAQLSSSGGFSLGPLRTSWAYQTLLESVYRGSYYGGYDDYSSTQVSGQVTAQVALNQTIALMAQNSWEEYKTVSPSITYFSRRSGGLHWTLSDSPNSLFDPAHLGQSGYAVKAGFDLLAPRIEDTRFFNPATTLASDPLVVKPSGSLAGSVLLFGSRLSLGTSVAGFYDFGAVSGGLVAPAILSSLGGSSWFPGYPASYAAVSEMVTGVLQVKTNPLVNKATRPQFWDRMNLGGRVEVGAGHYFSTAGGRGLKVAIPVSAEVSLQSGFFMAPDHQSGLSFRFAMALNDFVANDGGPALDSPFQVYIGYQY